jgi:hypothetical protein
MTGQTKTVSTVSGYELGGQKKNHKFQIHADESRELLGENTASPARTSGGGSEHLYVGRVCSKGSGDGFRLEKLADSSLPSLMILSRHTKLCVDVLTPSA